MTDMSINRHHHGYCHVTPDGTPIPGWGDWIAGDRLPPGAVASNCRQTVPGHVGICHPNGMCSQQPVGTPLAPPTGLRGCGGMDYQACCSGGYYPEA